VRSRTTRHLHDNRSNGSWSASWSSDDGPSAQLHATGTVSASPDLRDFALSPGATLEVTQREGGVVRQLTMRADAQGRVERFLVINGRTHPWDAGASAWLASFIEDLDRHTAFAAKSRVQQLLREGGVDRALSEVERIDGTYAKGAYLRLLIASAPFNTDQLVRALRASRSFSSDYELANVLTALTSRYDFSDERARNAFLKAAATLRSDYELGRVLQGFFAKEKLDDAQTQAVLAAASRMRSDYEKANVLIALTDRRLLPKASRKDYLATASTLRSDYEHGRVLKALAREPDLDADTLAQMAKQTSRMHSDYEAASTLIELSRQRALAGAARDAYERAAQGLRSQYERDRALSALADTRK
jgi:hypothetical protein